MTKKLLIATPMAMVLALVLTSVVTAWSSNRFVSPSRNIACRFVASGSAGPFVACATRNDGFTLSLANDGTKGQILSNNGHLLRALRGFNSPVLRYGRRWRSGVGIWCISRTSGMTCRASSHGFFLSRGTYDVW